MKNVTFIGENIKQIKARVKVLPSGGFIIDTGSSDTQIKGKKPIFESEVELTKDEFKKLRQDPESFKFDKKEKKFVKKNKSK